mmetsp:Transcript_5334/g.6734  ORF Transcript_5334/g.6734 Transcript_5334/m.6734 type:complete len:134 (-) Transcript_5334:106-507(-)
MNYCRNRITMCYAQVLMISISFVYVGTYWFSKIQGSSCSFLTVVVQHPYDHAASELVSSPKFSGYEAYTGVISPDFPSTTGSSSEDLAVYKVSIGILAVSVLLLSCLLMKKVTDTGKGTADEVKPVKQRYPSL